MTLPANGWRVLRRHGTAYGYAFTGPGPIRRVRVKSGKIIRVFGKGSGLGHTLGGDPAPVRVVVTLGKQQYCMSFGGTVAFTPGTRYAARGAYSLLAEIGCGRRAGHNRPDSSASMKSQ